MSEVKDLMFPNGTYTNNDGEEKTRWIKVGALFTRADGKQSILLDAIPCGRNDKGELWLSAFAKTAAPARRRDSETPF